MSQKGTGAPAQRVKTRRQIVRLHHSRHSVLAWPRVVSLFLPGGLVANSHVARKLQQIAEHGKADRTHANLRGRSHEGRSVW